MNRWRKVALGLVAIVVVIVFSAMALISRSHALSLITHPIEVRNALRETPGDYGLPYEDVTAISADGLELAGWYIPSQNGAVIMAQHGYKSDRTGLLEEAQMLFRHGYGVLLTTIRAHDLSAGNQISFGYHEMQDLEAWYQSLLTRDEVNPNKIGVLGNSMGGSLVIQYAAQNRYIKAVVAHSAFSSLDDTVATSVGYFTGLPPFPFATMIVFWAEQELGLETSDINAKLWIRDLSPRPVLLMQGGKDTQISVSSGKLLYEAAGEPKELWFEPELGHSSFDKALPEAFEQRIVGFFDKYLLGE